MLPCKSAAVRLSVCLTGVQCTRWHCDTRYTDGRKTVRGEPVTSTRTQGLLQESQQTGEGTSTCNWRNCQHCLLHYVNLIVFTLLLAHLVLRISPHHSHHPRSHHLSLPRVSTFHSRLKTHLFHKSFPPQSLLFLPDCLHGS